MEKLNTLYNVIVKVAKERDAIPERFESARKITAQFGRWTPEQIAEHKADELKLWNTKNHMISAAVAEYQARGGKHDVSQFIKADR